MTKVCISGYYGFNNVGDEAILLSMIHELRSNFEDIEIIVLSDKPEETAATYGVEARNRWKWREIHKALMSSDLLISGGGGLLQDITGKKSLLYYTNIMKMAMRRKKPVFIFSQGIGPINSKWGQDRVVKVLRKAVKITVRDEESAQLLHGWGLRKGRIRVTADPVLLMEDIKHFWDTRRFARLLDPSRFDTSNINADNETEIEICLVDQATLNNLVAENAGKLEAQAAAAKALAEEATQEQSVTEVLEDEALSEVPAEDPEVEKSEGAVEEDVEKTVEEDVVVNYDDYGILGLHPSAWKKEGENLAVFALRDWENFPVEDMAKAGDMVAEAGYKIVFLPFQYPNDVEISQKVMDKMEYVADLFDAKVPLTPEEILVIMEEADFVFGMRLHSLIMAAITKTPFASLSYNPKVASFVGQLGLTVTGDFEDYDSETFFETLTEILVNPAAVTATITEHLEEVQEKAESAMTLIHTILDRMERRSTRKRMTKEEREAMETERRTNREAFREEMHLYDEPVSEQETEGDADPSEDVSLDSIEEIDDAFDENIESLGKEESEKE